DSGAKGGSLGMLDRHSIAGPPVGLGKPGQRMSATAASLAGVSKNLGLNPNLSLPNATSTFSNRWSLSSLAANNNSAGTMEPIGRPSSLMGSGEALSSGLWRRNDLGMDAGKANSGSRGKAAGNLHLRPDRPGSALGGEMASLANNTWGFSSSSNIVGMNDPQPPVTERPKSATDFDLTPDWRAVSNSNRSSRIINEPEVKSSLRQSLGDDSSIIGEHRAAGKIGVNSGAATNAPGEPPTPGGSLAARRLGAHKFSVATYDANDGQVPAALKSPLKSPMFAGGLKGARATGSRPTTPALPPGFYQHPQSPWGLNSNAPPGGVVDMGALKQAIPPLTPTSLRNPAGLAGGEGYNGNGGGPYNHPHLAYHHHMNSPVRSKFPFNQSGGPHTGHPSGSSAAGGHLARAQSPATSSVGAGNAGGANKANRSQDQLDPNLLEDIPGWLRSLRLHKYTHCFQDMHWKEMVKLTDEELTTRGVAALGARRKMLKVFDAVKQDMVAKGELSAPSGYEASTSATTTPSLTPSTQPAQLPAQNDATTERQESHTSGETVKPTDL
ncbi:Flap-structured DNA-binding and RNA-binding protein, partial [Dispira parvispora]